MKVRGFVRAAYGIDIAPGRVRVVRCATNQLHAACETIYDGPPPVTGIAADRLREEGKRLDVAISGGISPHIAFARWVHTPLNSVEKSLRVFPSLLDVQIPFAVEQCEVAAAHIRREENRAISILAVACRRDDIRTAIAEFEAAGVTPDVLDHEGLALWSQTLKECPAETTGPRVVAFLRDHSVTLAVGEGGQPDGFLTAQGFRRGTEDFLDPVRGSSVRREFATKVRQMLLVHLPERLEPLALTWFWSGTLPDRVRSELESELRIVGPPKFLQHEQPETFLARALAIRAWLGESVGGNLLRGRLTPPKEQHRRERTHYRLAGALVAAGLSLAISAVALGWGQTRLIRHLDQRVSTLAQELTDLARIPRGQELLIVQRTLADRADADAVLRRCAKDELAARVMRGLELCSQLGAELEWVSWREDAFTARGSLKDWNDGEAFVQWLEKEGFTANLSRRDAGPNGRVPFSLNASKRALGGKP